MQSLAHTLIHAISLYTCLSSMLSQLHQIYRNLLFLGALVPWSLHQCSIWSLLYALHETFLGFILGAPVQWSRPLSSAQKPSPVLLFLSLDFGELDSELGFNEGSKDGFKDGCRDGFKDGCIGFELGIDKEGYSCHPVSYCSSHVPPFHLNFTHSTSFPSWGPIWLIAAFCRCFVPQSLLPCILSLYYFLSLFFPFGFDLLLQYKINPIKILL